MKIRLLKPWKIWSTDHVIPDMPDNVATDLIRRGYAESVPDLRDTVAPRKRPGMRAGADYVTR